MCCALKECIPVHSVQGFWTFNLPRRSGNLFFGSASSKKVEKYMSMCSMHRQSPRFTLPRHTSALKASEGHLAPLAPCGHLLTAPIALSFPHCQVLVLCFPNKCAAKGSKELWSSVGRAVFAASASKNRRPLASERTDLCMAQAFSGLGWKYDPFGFCVK